MAPKKGAAKPKKAATGASRDEEWVPSKMGEAELNRMVSAAFFQIASRSDGDQPTVSPIRHPILMKLWYLKITFGEGWGSLFTLFLEIYWSFGRLASAICTPTPYCMS